MKVAKTTLVIGLWLLSLLLVSIKTEHAGIWDNIGWGIIGVYHGIGMHFMLK